MTNEELCCAIQRGENVTANLERLYVQNFGMIRKISNRFAGVEELEDLQQEAYFGIVRAAEMWDPQHDVLFISYAPYWIKQVLIRYVYDHNGLIRVPCYQRDRFRSYRRAVNSYRMQFARDPEPREVMFLLEITREQYEQLLKDMQTANVRKVWMYSSTRMEKPSSSRTTRP